MIPIVFKFRSEIFTADNVYIKFGSDHETPSELVFCLNGRAVKHIGSYIGLQQDEQAEFVTKLFDDIWKAITDLTAIASTGLRFGTYEIRL